MRRLTLEDCEQLLQSKAGVYEVDRCLEGGEDTVGAGGVVLEVVKQLKDAIAGLTFVGACPVFQYMGGMGYVKKPCPVCGGIEAHEYRDPPKPTLPERPT